MNLPILHLRIAFKLLALIALTLNLALFSSESLILQLFLLSLARLCNINFQFVILEIQQTH